MLRKLIRLSLVIYLVQSAAPAFAQRTDQVTTADKARAAIAKLGTCPKAKVEVLFRDKTSLKGCVVDVSEDHFGIVEAKTGKVTRASYDDVAGVKKRGHAAWKDIVILGGVIALPAIILSLGLRGG